MPPLDDVVYEGATPETFVVGLASRAGADLGSTSAESVRLTDNAEDEARYSEQAQVA